MSYIGAEMSVILRKCTTCGLEAKNESDLDLFERNKNAKYGRINRCKKCRRQLPKPYLRKCRICGLEAHTEEDLQKFMKGKYSFYGRQLICKNCYNKRDRDKNKILHPKSDFIVRKNKLLNNLSRPILCYFCNLEITVLNGKAPDSLCFHSLDFNHDNWSPENKVPAHKKCHNSHHSTHSSVETRLKISLANSGDKCYMWKGDDAKSQAKSIRKRSEERRIRKAKLLEIIKSNK